jgi:hypothetical protein
MFKSFSELRIDDIKTKGRSQLPKLALYRHRQRSTNNAIKALMVVIQWCQEATEFKSIFTPDKVYASECYWFNHAGYDAVYHDYVVYDEYDESDDKNEEIFDWIDKLKQVICRLRRLYRSTVWMRKKLEQMLLDKRESVFKYRIRNLQYRLVLRSGVSSQLTGLSGDLSEDEVN